MRFLQESASIEKLTVSNLYGPRQKPAKISVFGSKWIQSTLIVFILLSGLTDVFQIYFNGSTKDESLQTTNNTSYLVTEAL